MEYNRERSEEISSLTKRLLNYAKKLSKKHDTEHVKTALKEAAEEYQEWY